MMVLVCLLVVFLVVLGVLFMRTAMTKKRVSDENKLLSQRLESLSSDSSRKIQVLARLAQALSSSFNRGIILQQTLGELASFFPEIMLSIALKSKDDTTHFLMPAVQGDSAAKNLSVNSSVPFVDVTQAAQNSSRQLGSVSFPVAGFDNPQRYGYFFAILTNEQLRGYLLLSVEKPLVQNFYLFFTDITTLLASILQNILTMREKEYINDQFGRSVDPRVRDYLLASKGEGRVLSLSVMFFDLRNFTTLSEKLGPVKTVQLLNRLFSLCEEIISQNGGFINKFTGDGFMAVFGAPIPSDNHEMQAVLSAQSILKHIDIPAGIGIASGAAVAGTIGSEKRKEYTVIGDTVNTASRVEGMCKVFGSSLIISKATQEKAGACCAGARFLGIIRLKGKADPVQLYDLLPKSDQYNEAFSAAVSAYYAQDFARAHSLFADLCSAFPDDKAAAWYEARCILRAQQAERGETWDGVEQMTAK